MIIACLTLELYLPYSHSLKDKRKRLKSLRDRLKTRYNVAFAEVEFHNKWQRTKIAVVTLNNQTRMIEKTLDRILRDVDDLVDGEILQKQIDYYR